jgi:sn-glycerol 3-phosphate transport system ATP-binding protein
MDEPLSNLDAQLRHGMRVEIRALQQRLAMTVVYVTHDQVEAMSMADRVVLLRAGRIEQNGTPVTLYEAPANTFVARFIGTPPMNLLDLAKARDGTVIAGTDGPVVLDIAQAKGKLGVRPEHIQLAFESGVRGGVDSVEYLGGDSLVSCRIGGQAVAVRVAGSVGLRSGDAAWMRWARGAQHYFDEDGRRADTEPREAASTMLA